MKKFTALLLHLAFVAVAVLGLSLMYLSLTTAGDPPVLPLCVRGLRSF